MSEASRSATECEFQQELVDALGDLARVLKAQDRQADSLTCTKAAIWIDGSKSPSTVARRESGEDFLGENDYRVLLLEARHALINLNGCYPLPYPKDELRDLLERMDAALDGKLAPSSTAAHEPDCALADRIEKEVKELQELTEDRGDPEYWVLHTFLTNADRICAALRAPRVIPSAKGETR